MLNGTAGEHSDIHLQLFADSLKDVALFLLNKNVSFRRFGNTLHFKQRGTKPVETLSFLWHHEGVHLAFTSPMTCAAHATRSQKAGRAELADAAEC